MAGIQNLSSIDFFADAKEETEDKSKVHVRVQQRNGRKCITLIEGLQDDLDLKKILKAFKKNFSCNGAITHDDEVGDVIQLSGDQRTNVKEFLEDQEIINQGQCILHGF
uniref:SUI1 domain-containing protein n=1 Tax=Fibrocapsa japonica TaxID=94617 RepID=A0A7S2Y0G0_9STRA|mmetsp:Transcript_8202/g.12546  ORF Transcript_8202/g.12546 Transcript_8202/m.12546 type:complete len:109 (+) Transcript_8202:61-387(+)|eukprot:CAMPEP_0113944862 /NCGR_PEP_ID=MMETSP1339-20121228/37384_1 /TAXON_ID=94617 /ORGANISM="Fibrocapsa japonica" /LENGTH=108 /DNA_ID=CAMNT_0000950203 /DNA_START=51 /DNA_END=377 /DNA_ORIENTATION=+ /assembly_acc=CAM_ASM_000762